MSYKRGFTPSTAPIRWAFLGRHRADGFTLRWQRGNRVEYVLSGQRLGDYGMTEVLGAIRRARIKGVLATSVLGEHTDEAGRCVVGGSTWPCELVVLAAHNLALI
jgi:hypothetical protein